MTARVLDLSPPVQLLLQEPHATQLSTAQFCDGAIVGSYEGIDVGDGVGIGVGVGVGDGVGEGVGDGVGGQSSYVKSTSPLPTSAPSWVRVGLSGS